MANEDEFEDLPIPFASESSRPLAEPQSNDFESETGEAECPQCGRKFKNAHALSMHRVRIHEGVKWNNRSNKAEATPTKARKPYKRKPKPAPEPKREHIVLDEVYADGGENGRILLTDQHGNWWVARKLDV